MKQDVSHMRFGKEQTRQRKMPDGSAKRNKIVSARVIAADNKMNK